LPCTAHLHNYGININYAENFKISDSYKNRVNLKTTSTARDTEGKGFTCTNEDINNKIYLLIFHPEHLPYNDSLKDVTHIYNEKAFYVSRKIGMNFIEQAKKSNNRFVDLEDKRKWKFIEDEKFKKDFECYNLSSQNEYDYRILKYKK
jgi:hypothetical protein